jgi:5-methylcytosine-specific restriction endonuclease McrA
MAKKTSNPGAIHLRII